MAIYETIMESNGNVHGLIIYGMVDSRATLGMTLMEITLVDSNPLVGIGWYKTSIIS